MYERTYDVCISLDCHHEYIHVLKKIFGQTMCPNLKFRKQVTLAMVLLLS